jgi:ABC-type polysaccharide/polyol phosphate export permease
VAQGTAVPLNRIERILAFVLAAVAGLTIIALIAVFVAGAAGVDRTSGIWPVVFLLPAIGLPIMLIVGIVLIVVMGTRRRRLAAGDARK